MNILVFSWRGPKHPLAGGAEQVMHEHMKGWIEKGHSVTLFTSFYPGAKVCEIIDGVKIVRSGRQLIGVHFNAFIWYLFKNKEKFDLVVDQFHGIPFFTPLYIRKPVLAVIQEVTKEIWFAYPIAKPFNLILGTIGYVTEPVIFRLYKLFNVTFMTGSESAKKDLMSMGIRSNKINIVPHGVIIIKPKKKLTKEKTPTIIFLGALAKDKGIEDALSVFSILNKDTRYNFWVIGKSSETYLNELKEMSRKLGLDKRLTFWGFVSQEKKFELLARGHIMLNPSIREGWGLVNIEANSMNTPVVAYTSQGLVDSVIDGRTGVLCKVNSPVEMAKNVEVLLKNTKKLKLLQENAYKWSQEFTWEKSRSKSLILIESITK